MKPMRAMILAAGRGERMRPLTDTCPKPLLAVRGQPLIAWHLAALARAGVREVVINTAHLEDQFPAALGDGNRWGLRLHYAAEGRLYGGALETAGGVASALPLLAPHGDEPFWVVSADIYAPDFAFDTALAQAFAASTDEAWIWVVPNPEFNPKGDFALASDRLLRDAEPRPYTYANFALMRPALVAGVAPGQRAALAPCLFRAAAAGRLGGRVYGGEWHNVGTPAQLAALNAGARA